MDGHRQGEERDRLGPQERQRLGQLARERPAPGGVEDLHERRKLLQNSRDSRLFIPTPQIAQYLTSAEHCRGLKCYRISFPGGSVGVEAQRRGDAFHFREIEAQTNPASSEAYIRHLSSGANPTFHTECRGGDPDQQ